MSNQSQQQTITTENGDAVEVGKEQKEQLDVLEQLLKPEVQEALTTLVDNLPKLAELTTILTKSYDIANSLTTDKVLYNDMVGSVKEMAKPIEGKVKEFASAAIEANDKTKVEHEAIGLFGMLRMLKDPQVQKMLHFSQAFLEILSEKQRQK